MMFGLLFKEVIQMVEMEEPILTSKLRLGRKTLDDFVYMENASYMAFSDLFRFRSVAQIRRLIQGFQIPEIIRVKGSKFSNEEGMFVLVVDAPYIYIHSAAVM